jgi:Na+/H+-dicarboxylate symporter
MAHAKTAVAGTTHGKPFYQSLYVQVLTAIAIGVALGHFYPEIGEQMKPLGDAFIKMIKMIIAPIIFCTVVHGIASMQDMKKVGRVGLKALIYFEVLTTIALIVGLIVMNVLQPGAAMNVDVNLGCEKSVVGLVIPTGYSFNLDGTCIYLTMAAFFSHRQPTQILVCTSNSASSASSC